MEYTLNVRAFLRIKRKDKAIAHMERLFPELPAQIKGKYYVDDSLWLWECTVNHDCEYVDDKTALWETLTYFAAIESNWLLLVCPNSQYETLVSASAENNDGTGMAWCHFELMRLQPPA